MAADEPCSARDQDALSSESVPQLSLLHFYSVCRIERHHCPPPRTAQIHVSRRERRTFAGTPATTAYSGTSCVTTAPAPTIACGPMRTPGRMLAFIPISAPNPTTTGFMTSALLMIGPSTGSPPHA